MARKPRKLKRETPENLSPAEFVAYARAEREHELKAITNKFLLWAHSFCIVTTVLIVFLQGFRVGGFELPSTFLNWLGAATIGQTGGLIALTISAKTKLG